MVQIHSPDTPKILPFISLRYVLRFDYCSILWTNVDQFKTKPMRPIHFRRNVTSSLSFE